MIFSIFIGRKWKKWKGHYYQTSLKSSRGNYVSFQGLRIIISGLMLWSMGLLSNLPSLVCISTSAAPLLKSFYFFGRVADAYRWEGYQSTCCLYNCGSLSFCTVTLSIQANSVSAKIDFLKTLWYHIYSYSRSSMQLCKKVLHSFCLDKPSVIQNLTEMNLLSCN